MAIKVNNVTVIDDSRNATVVNASADSLTYSGTNVLATAAEINQLDGVTDNVQTQIDSSAKVAGTLDRTFSSGETVSLTLSNTVSTPVVSVTKEVPQTGVTSNDWDVAADGSNFTLHDTAYDTTLTPSEMGYVIGSASYDSVSLDLSPQDTFSSGIVFNADGTKMYTLGGVSESVYQYSLSTAFDISTASYDSVSFNVTSQTTDPRGLTFNTDGTKMYITDDGNGFIHQYSLSTGFDLSTASYDSVSFDASTQEPDPWDTTFNTDGTKMYVVGAINDSVHQYSLSTAFDISTASYDSVSLNVLGQDTGPNGIAFNTDGTKMYVVGANNDSVYQYTLSTAFDLSTASYDSVSFSVTQQDTSPFDITFNNDGTKMYMVGNNSDSVHQYTTSAEGLVLGTGSFAAEDVGKRIVGNGGEAILTATDGSYELQTAFNDASTIAAGDWSMFGLDVESEDAGLTLAGLSQFYNLENASYDSVSFSVLGQDTSPRGITFNTDGTKMYIIGIGNTSVYQYTLSTAFDLSTASYDNVSFSVGTQESAPRDIVFNDNGTKFYVCGTNTDSVYEYVLSTAFDISTASYNNVSLDISSLGNTYGLEFNNDGTKLYFVEITNDSVHQYSLTTAYDLSTATSDNVSFSVAGQDAFPIGIAFNNDGTKMHIAGLDTDSIYQYSLSAAFDLNTASYDSVSFSVSAQDGTLQDIAFNNDGTKLYMVGNNTDSVYQYTTSSFVLPTNTNHTAVTSTSTNTEFWTDINSMTADDSVNDGSVYYAVSTDDRTTWSIIDDTNGVRNIVRNNGGTWEVNDASDYSTETWVAASENDEFYALEEAVDIDTAQSVIGFDLENASYDNVSFSVSGQQSFPSDLAFNADGTKMYTIDAGTDSVYQYSLNTQFDLNTASYDNISFDVSGQDTGALGIIFNNTGDKMYIIGTSANSVYQYSLSTAFDIDTASYDNVSLDISGQDGSARGIKFNNDGTKMYMAGQDNDSVFEYTLNTAFDLSTASYNSVFFSVGEQDTGLSDIELNTDGTKMFILGGSNDSVFQYTLNTPFDLSTVSYDSVSFSVSGQDTSPRGLTFNTDGSKMYMLGASNGSVYQYTTSSTTSTNRMDATQLNGVSDANHYTLGNDLDLAITLFMADGNTNSPTSDGVAINYDANVKNEGAVLGTDYEFDKPANDTVRITALSNENFKVRVV